MTPLAPMSCVWTAPSAVAASVSEGNEEKERERSSRGELTFGESRSSQHGKLRRQSNNVSRPRETTRSCRLLHPRPPHRREIVDHLAPPSHRSRVQQPPLALDRIVRDAARLERLPPFLADEKLAQLARPDVLVVGVRAGRHEAEDVFGECDGEEFCEGRARDGRKDEVAAGLRSGMWREHQPQ